MTKLLTLRNIITLLVLFIFTACEEGNNNNIYSYKSDLKTISSEDKGSTLTPIGEIVDEESGRVIYRIVRK